MVIFLFKKFLIYYCIVFIYYTNLPAKIIDVPTASNPNIQSGIDDAQDGDTVLVQPGRYKENLDMKGKNIVLSSLYIIENDSDFISTTIIDGGGKWCVIDYNQQENVTCELNGFTLTNGNGVVVEGKYRHGGAIYCWNSNPTLKNLDITGNQADKGGGIYCSKANPKIENVDIHNNTQGIYCTTCSPELINVTITENIGRGLWLNDCPEITLDKIMITKNSQSGIYTHVSRINILESIIAENKAGIGSYHSSVRILNSTIVNNGKGIGDFQSSTIIKNSIFWNKSDIEVSLSQMMSGSAYITIEHSDIKGGRNSIVVGSGFPDMIYIVYDTTNIDSDPLFCDPENGIYTLVENSPCIGTANNGGNMGALEVGCSTVSIDIVNKFEQIPTILTLYQNYPNPFNPSTRIKFSLPKQETVKIEIFNIIGQKIETLLNKPMPTGYHEVEFIGQNLSSGVYLYRIETGAWRDMKKMILLR